jgi:hypothetical protein
MLVGRAGLGRRGAYLAGRIRDSKPAVGHDKGAVEFIGQSDVQAVDHADPI